MVDHGFASRYIHDNCRCRYCTKAYETYIIKYKISHAKARETDRKSSLRCRLALRKEVIAAYGGVCICCNEHVIDFLCVDHINNDGAEHRRTTKNIYKWLKRNKFPKDNFQVLCHNCNWAKHLHGACPHHPMIENTSTSKEHPVL